ncbi:MAG: DUF58 domain-containing protein [Candidatus Firestonebacteria bacterium]|nr:DUF58 domain-containing protein [Candidatus Firestonebacteria bacterium]
MLPKEILKKIRRIEIQTNRLVNDVMSGEYHSVFKGRGMEFSGVREYQSGDDIRTIDWNVTARMGHPFVKKFVEERELTVMFLVDMSKSNAFGTYHELKQEIATEICALLAFSAIKNNDKVGLLIFTDKIEKYVPPVKGRKHVLRVIRELLYMKPEGKNTDMKMALDYLNKITCRKTVAFLISDFLTSGYEKALRIANKRHDLIGISITDPRELSLPDVGLLSLTDSETGEQILVDTNDPDFRNNYGRLAYENKDERAKMFRKINVDSIDICTDKSYVIPLVSFFKARAKRYR